MPHSLVIKEAGPLLFWRGFQGGVLADSNGGILLANEALCRGTGYSAAELARRDFHSLLAPEWRPQIADQVANLLQGNLTSFELRAVLVKSTGERVAVPLRVDLLKKDDQVFLLFQTALGVEPVAGSGPISSAAFDSLRVLAFLRAHYPLILMVVTGLATLAGYALQWWKDHVK